MAYKTAKLVLYCSDNLVPVMMSYDVKLTSLDVSNLTKASKNCSTRWIDGIILSRTDLSPLSHFINETEGDR